MKIWKLRTWHVAVVFLAGSMCGAGGMPVVDKTGIVGAYDFNVEPFSPENESADVAAVGAMHRLGLDLKRVKGPVRMVVIDNIQRPTPN